jgi:hypothetical protein
VRLTRYYRGSIDAREYGARGQNRMKCPLGHLTNSSPRGIFGEMGNRMTAIADKKLRFSDAVFALETTPKSLRKWLQNPAFRLISEQPEGEWKNFSFADIGCLAIMRKLVDFGVGVVDANEIAADVIKHKLGPLLKSKTMPPRALEAGFANMTLVVWRDRENWGFDLLNPLQDAPDEEAILFVYLGSVMKRAVSRAIESANDGCNTS